MAVYNDHARPIIMLTAFMAPISILAVVLRFVARWKTKSSYKADDWFALAGLVSLLAYMVQALWDSQHGFGYDLRTLPPPVVVRYLKGIYTLALLATTPMTAAKFSVLCLYNRLFGCDRHFRLAVVVLAILNLLWFLAATVTVALKCVPVEKSWNTTIPGTCFNFSAFIVAIECPNALLDFIMVALPVNIIRRLQLSLHRKILVGFIFVLGGFVGVIGFIRIALVYSPGGISLPRMGVWLMVQLSVGIICACLPTYACFLPSKGLVSARFRQSHSLAAFLLGRGTRSSAPESEGRCPNLDKPSYPDDQYSTFNEGGDKVVLTHVVGGGTSPSELMQTDSDYLSNAIRVKNEVEMF